MQVAFERRALGESYGAIARWLNAESFRPRGKNAIFTPFAVKDMLKNRFYLGYVRYQGEEFVGQHEPLVDEQLFERVQARRGRGRISREPHGTYGLLRGRLLCGRCDSRLHSERNRRHEPRYRERHGRHCITNGRSLTALTIDEQIGMIWRSIELDPDWRDRIAEYASTEYRGPSLRELNERRRRLARAYGDGAYSDDEYQDLLRSVEEQFRAATRAVGPKYEETAAILADLPGMWDAARHEERRKLLMPMLEQLYVDVEHGEISGLVPTPEFREIFEHALRRCPGSRVVVLTSSETRRVMSGVGLVETGEN